jgi:tyrosine-protein kinase Etk/Wzc
MIDAKSQSLLITSTSPEAGKSFTSVNLAAVMAQSGKRVVVVDADLRRGTLRRYFDTPRGSRGLSEVLSREAKLAEVVRSGPIENLFYVTAGNYPPNPSELLMRAEFEEMIKELSTDYDFVIVDAPPVLAVTDPVILSKYVGATMMVVRHKKTTAPELEAATRVFENGGSKFTGAILNGYRAEASNRGGYYYYYNKRYSYEQKGKNSD